MKIALCQIDPIIGHLEYNKQKILDGYKKAIDAKADLAIFPELSLVGYPPLDLVEKQEFRKAVNKAAKEIASQTTEVGLIFGAITEDNDKIGTDIHNSAILCFDGKIQFVQYKTLIPNYDVFDEMRYFDSAESAVSYTHLRAHETVLDLVCRLLLEKKKKTNNKATSFDSPQIQHISAKTR